jgi:molecular chaperone HscB
MTTNTQTALCLHCGKPAADQLVCGGCGVVEPTAQESDYFSVFSLPRRLTIDLADLEQRYYALSRRLHPDLFHDRPSAEQAASLRTTALVNRAYRTLRDPVQRGLYWLELHGESLGRDNERVPSALAARVFEVQEQLEELRAARTADPAAGAIGAMTAIRDELCADLAACEARLTGNFTRTDVADDGAGAAAALADTKAILSELHYLRTLLRDVEKELGPAWNAS